ncbi:TPA: hypothetical protein ACS29V_003316 [Klebsiella oxytoca]
MSYLLLLGAGASYGSVDTSPYCPPLGNKLFEHLEAEGGIASTIPPEMKTTFRDNFEKGMALFFDTYPVQTMQFQRELAGYLAKFTPGINNIYFKLLRKIEPANFIFSSLNYDLLLECCSFHSGYPPYYAIDNNYKPKHIKILKIHGSSNFWYDKRVCNISDSTFSNGYICDIELPIVPVHQKEAISRAKTENSMAPSMAIFAEGKSVRVSDSYVKWQYEQWVESVKKSSKIFIVGVRVHIVDAHIWEILGQADAEVHYFGFKTDKPEFDEWTNQSNKENAFFHEANFENAVDIISRLGQ